MNRRDFVGEFLVGGTLLGTRGSIFARQAGPPPQAAASTINEGVFLERAATGKPHAGKVLAAIQPHTDDVPIFAGGTVAKLVGEGYTGYLIRTTNDEMAGSGTTGSALPGDRPAGLSDADLGDRAGDCSSAGFRLRDRWRSGVVQGLRTT